MGGSKKKDKVVTSGKSLLEYMTEQLESTKKIYAPFTLYQVEQLNRYQTLRHVHPVFLCKTSGCNSILIATMQGWICESCDYTQDWAFQSMADKEFIDVNIMHIPNQLGKA